MRIKKADANQADLVRQIRKIPGATVTHIHTVGNGCPDIIIGHQKVSYLCEIKDPAKPPSARKLTPDEEKFHREWTGHICIIETIDDVLDMLGLNLLN